MAHTRKLDDIDVIEMEIELKKKTEIMQMINPVVRKVKNLADRMNDNSELYFTLEAILHFLQFIVADTAREIAVINESLPRIRKEVDRNNSESIPK